MLVLPKSLRRVVVCREGRERTPFVIGMIRAVQYWYQMIILSEFDAEELFGLVGRRA